jgi:hypothetical protein
MQSTATDHCNALFQLTQMRKAPGETPRAFVQIRLHAGGKGPPERLGSAIPCGNRLAALRGRGFGLAGNGGGKNDGGRTGSDDIRHAH